MGRIARYLGHAWIRLVLAVLTIGLLGIVPLLDPPMRLLSDFSLVGALVTVAYGVLIGWMEDLRIRRHWYALPIFFDTVMTTEIRGPDFGPTGFGRRAPTSTGLTAS